MPNWPLNNKLQTILSDEYHQSCCLVIFMHVLLYYAPPNLLAIRIPTGIRGFYSCSFILSGQCPAHHTLVLCPRPKSEPSPINDEASMDCTCLCTCQECSIGLGSRGFEGQVDALRSPELFLSALYLQQFW